MNSRYPELVLADAKGRIYNTAGIAAVGMKGGHFFSLAPRDLVKLPATSELFMLPNRLPIGFDPEEQDFKIFTEDPFSRRPQPCCAVAAFIAPGYTLTHTSAYRAMPGAAALPLFAYGAVCMYRGGFYAAAVRVDKDRRHDIRFINDECVARGVQTFTKLFPSNRLIRHLAGCALTYGCPNAKNFFLHRYEAPLPSAPSCNARCAGCISYQQGNAFPAAQPRITFVPSPEEIAEAALFHIAHVRKAIVSFGQGCEGEPLLSARTLIKAISLIRKKTRKGVINLNTNASMPREIERLFDAGLDTIRVSLNSAQEPYYRRYYRPHGYGFKEVKRSVAVAKRAGGFVSLNYFVMPGFTDWQSEYKALRNFVEHYRVDMIQLRNLNYDPYAYFELLKVNVPKNAMCGVKEVIASLRSEFPCMRIGYFNPAKTL